MTSLAGVPEVTRLSGVSFRPPLPSALRIDGGALRVPRIFRSKGPQGLRPPEGDCLFLPLLGSTSRAGLLQLVDGCQAALQDAFDSDRDVPVKRYKTLVVKLQCSSK